MIRSRRFREIAALAILGLVLACFWKWNFYVRQITPQLALLCVVGFLLCAIFRLYVAGAAWALAAIIGLSAIAPDFLPRISEPRSGCIVSVVTFNKAIEPPEYVNDIGAARMLAALHPDVIFAQKVDGASFLGDLLANGLGGYRGFASPTKPSLIASRFPIVRINDPQYGMSIDVLVEGREVTLKNMYTTRPNHDWAAYIADYAGIREEAAIHRNPLILAGDANATEFTPQIRDLREVLADSWGEAGFGLGFTWPTRYRQLGLLGPWLRIDYIFHNRAFDAVSARRIDDGTGAGHFPVLAKLAFVGAGKPGAPCQ